MKRILILSYVLITALTANAQSLGARVGVNFSNIIKTGDSDFETDFKPGLHAGITLDIPLVDRLSFAPELMFSQKGYKTNGSSLLGGDNEYSVTTNFIEVPILLKINAASGFNIHLGPQVSFLTSTTESFKTGSDEYKTKIKEENDNLKKNILGGVIGAGFNVGARTSLVARYALDFQKNNEDGSSETPLYKNQVIQLGLGFKF
ncbi:porin family protein [Pedobacter sp. P351]|uniref:porin family protein n=1 Tax=Pedobacter superstes TaxID=3133441 RepID=UPI0030A79E3C